MSNEVEPVRPEDWKCEDMPERCRRLPLSLDYSPAQFERIGLGLCPDAMEDKWFVCFEGDTLRMYRSWTGFEIYRVRLEMLEGGGARAVEVVVNDERSQYAGLDDEDETARVEFLINVLLAHNGWVPELPPEADDEGSPLALHLWSDIGRALMGQGPRPGRNQEAPQQNLH